MRPHKSVWKCPLARAGKGTEAEEARGQQGSARRDGRAARLEVGVLVEALHAHVDESLFAHPALQLDDRLRHHEDEAATHASHVWRERGGGERGSEGVARVP